MPVNERRQWSSSVLTHKTGKFLSDIAFSDKDIVSIIQNQWSLWRDVISVCCKFVATVSVPVPFEIVYKACLEAECFLSEWKKVNIVSINKSWQTITENYCPTSVDLWKNIVNSSV